MKQQPDHREIYTSYANEFERLVSRSDYQENIVRELDRIKPLLGLDVVELGAGTGRLTCKLAPLVNSIQAFDASPHMLEVAVAKLEKQGWRNWQVGVADNRSLPLDDGVADLSIAGWSICYTVLWHEQTWPDELSKALAEMKRVLRPGGAVILLESLGTGYRAPRPPRSLEVYFEFLRRAGFTSTWIRTDYHFESLKEAEVLTSFFFGADKVERIVNENLVALPEYTGVWSLRV